MLVCGFLRVSGGVVVWVFWCDFAWWRVLGFIDLVCCVGLWFDGFFVRVCCVLICLDLVVGFGLWLGGFSLVCYYSFGVVPQFGSFGFVGFWFWCLPIWLVWLVGLWCLLLEFGDFGLMHCRTGWVRRFWLPAVGFALRVCAWIWCCGRMRCL